MGTAPRSWAVVMAARTFAPSLASPVEASAASANAIGAPARGTENSP